MDKTTDALRAVVDAARKWWHAPGMTEEMEDAADALGDAVKNLEEVLRQEGEKQSAGFVVPRSWGQLVTGNWVRVPNGDWYEVISSKREGALQKVGLKSPDGKVGVFPRNPDQKVSARIKTRHSIAASAFEVLAEAGLDPQVIDDPPWDE